MPSSINVNLRVTGHCSQGARKYMEDMFSVAYQQTEDEKDLEYAFFGIFDGHGGQQAATFAKEHLLDNIVNQKSFWSDKDAEVLRAIREGFLQTHLAMWRQLEHWPRTSVGFPSTSGTTASIAFIRRGKIYIGHVGDSSIVLGYQEGDGQWKGIPLTRDHKPESKEETLRIKQAGGKVVKKSGVPRVVWNRPRLGHRGPVRRSTPIDEIPFLAVARSLGDLWSYNPALDVFVVSPEPDVTVHTIDINQHRCLIFGTDGLWNVMSPNSAVGVVQAAETRNEQHLLQQGSTSNNGGIPHVWVNPSKSLVDRALEEWRSLQLQADNTSVVTLMLDPPGPPRVQVLLSQRQRQQEMDGNSCTSMTTSSSEIADTSSESNLKHHNTSDHLSPGSGVSIYTRICEPEPVPDSSSSGRVCSSPPASLPTSPSVALVCVQSNEVSSSSATKEHNPPVNREKSCRMPSPDSVVLSNSQGFKRRHSSGISQPSISSVEKRKRTRSEHDCPSSKDWHRDDDAASDAENDRVAWPPWNHPTWKASSTKPSQLPGNNKCVGPRPVKSSLPLLPVSSENTNLSCAHNLRSDTTADPPKRTLRSRNAPIEGPHRSMKMSQESAQVAIRLAPETRSHRQSWSRLQQPPMSMCTRSKGRQLTTHSK